MIGIRKLETDKSRIFISCYEIIELFTLHLTNITQYIILNKKEK